ncbi:MAG: hypothetical protein LV479_02780 [Methylacidiphilales bacterium]|nr:hypothetical protein [Candidatus Methylacidiphilales bacterium]
MTCELINAGRWRLSFAEPEAIFIINTLAQLGRHYQTDMAKLPPALQAYWRGTITRGETTDKNEMKESQEMLAEARAELRSERLELVESWIREFELAENREPWQVEISTAERDEFVAMLNDRRLLLALEIGITEGDMELDPIQISEEARRNAILEIDVLGHFILVTLGPQIYRP